MQFAVGPFTEHGHLGSRHGVAVAAVAGVAEVLHGHEHVGLGGVEVGRDADAEQEFAAAGVVHAELDGAQGAVVLAHPVDFGLPPARVAHGAVGIEPGSGMRIGAVNEAVVAPVGPPGVDDNPSADLVGRLFAVDAVAVEVELNAVVVAHDGEGVVDLGAPFGHILLFGYADGVVGGCRGYALPASGAGYADAYDAAGVEVGVAGMVPEPVFQQFAAFLSFDTDGEMGGCPHAVEHGGVPFVVARHPTEVVVRFELIAEEVGEGASAVDGG